MNNKLNANFSLRKLLLTALVAGPLATLPAPLWALPDITSTNLTKSAGVDITQVGSTTLNINAPDKAVLSWVGFGSAGNTINNGETLNFNVPTNGSVLNAVTGPLTTTINGTIASNGNVYVLNPAGIIIGQTAQINTGGFYASTISEPASFFSVNGSLSFTGTATTNVVVQGTGTVTGTNVATIQAIGPGNNIFLAGAGVNVQGGKFFGNLTVRSTTAAADLVNGIVPDASTLVAGRNTAFGSTGPVTVNVVGTSLSGGGLNVTTNGGNVTVAGNTTNSGSLTIAPSVNTSSGAVVINTGGGNITQGSAAFVANTTGTVVTLNAGTSTTVGTSGITLANVDFLTVGATGNAIAITDTANNLVLNSVNALGTLAVTTPGDLTQASGALHTVLGTIALKGGGGNTVNFTAAGNATFSSITTSSTLAITASGDVTFNGAVSTNRNLTVVSTGGAITGTSITSGSTLTLTATSSAGRLVANSIRSNSNGGTVNIAGDIVGTGVGGLIGINQSANGTLSVTSSTGNIAAGVVTNGATLNITATAGSISTGVIISNTLNMTAGGNISIANQQFASAPTVTITGGGGTGATAVVGYDTSTRQVTGITVTSGGSGYTAAPTVTLTGVSGNTQIVGTVTTLLPDKVLQSVGVLGTSITNAGNIVAGGSVTIGGDLTNSGGNLAITSSAGSITTAALSTNTGLTLTTSSTAGSITTGAITAATTRQLTINSAGDISLSAITAPVLVVNSTSGSISQSGAITSTSSATFNALSSITLSNSANDFSKVVLVGGLNGVQLTDNNEVIIGGGTAVTGNATITAGAGIAAYTTAPTVTISNNVINATGAARVDTVDSSLSSISITNAGSGYLSAPTVTITGGGGTGATAVATINTTTGVVNGYTITNPGSGYTTTPTVTVTAPTGTASTAVANLTNGVVTSVTVTPGTAKFATTPTITYTGGGGSGVTSTVALDSANLITGITPLQSGAITLGAAAVDNIVFGGNLSLNTGAGVAGTNGSTQYSVVTTNANSVRVFGNVSVTTNGTDATLGNPFAFGNAGNYSYGQINANLTSAAGKLTVVETQTTNLGTITANQVDIRSSAGNIVNTGKLNVAGTALFSAGTVFTQNDISLTNALNVLPTVSIGNARDFTLVTSGNTTVTAGSTQFNGKAATGAVNVTVPSGATLTLNTANGGDFNIVGFNSAGNVSITDPNSVTLQNATNTAGVVSVTAQNGVLTLGSGVALISTGNVTLTAQGANAAIVDSAPNVRIVGNSFLTSDGIIKITNAGHSFGAVSMETKGTNGATAADITYTEGGTANLNVVRLNTSANTAIAAPNLAVTSTGGGIIQTTTTGSIVVPQPSGSTNTVTFTAGAGGVVLNNPAGTNAITPSATITATADSTITQSGNVTLGNIAISAGGLSVDNSAVAGAFISQATGTTIKSYGNASFKTQAGKITLSNSNNNFGALSLVSDPTGVGVGADVAVTEAGTLNLGLVKTGTTGKLTVLSENASIVQTGNVSVGGSSSFTANSGSINLSNGLATNNFGGSAILLTTATGNVSLQDSNPLTLIHGNTTISAGSLSINNTNTGAGEIRDTAGTLTVFGNVTLATSSSGKITIGTATASLGGIVFRSGNVTITENGTMNLLPGSSATISATLTTTGTGSNIITTGQGGGNFQTLLLSSAGNITISSGIFVAAGLTFRALGAVDLSFLSLSGNLNSIAPTALTSTSYKPPQP